MNIANHDSILIVGARNSGKSSFGEFLRASLALPPRKQRPSYYPHDDGGDVTSRQTPNFRSEFLETEIAGERIGLTIWDSEGLEISIVDLQLREIVTFIESKFDETLTEETKVIRSPGVKDPHIHCVLLLLDPVNLNKTISDAKKKQEAAINGNLANGKSFLTDASPDSVSALDENMDLQVLRVLQGKTTVIPIISKADTITSEQMKLLKHAVYREIKTAKLDPFEVLGVEESEEEEDDSSSDADDREILQQHDHRRFREADEDEYRAQHDPEKSTFDLSDSSSEGSVIRRKNGNPSTKQEENTLPPLPLSVLTPEPITVHQPLIGATSRSFPWGSADPYNPKHCDFVRFKEAVFQEWFVELREASHELWYEGWRTSRLDAPRARTITLSPTPMPTQEPTIPILATNSKGPLAASSAQMTSKQSSRNVSAVYSPSPIAAQKQTQYLSPQQSYSPAQQQRSNPHSPSFNSPQELSASPVPSYRGSPQPIPLVSPQPSQNMSYQKQSQPSAQQQQLLQQQQQQSSQRGNSPFSVPHQQQGRQTPSKSPSTERQEVGVAR